MTTKRQSKLEKALQQNGIDETEALALIKSAKGKPSVKKRIRTPTATSKYIAISDTHIGHEKFDEPLMDEVIKRANKEKVDFVIHIGDHLEGMSGRPGHVYELKHIGYNAQMQAAVGFYNQFKVPIFGIDGNHDQWFKAKNDNGAIVGEDLERQVKNYTHLGEWEGRLDIGRGVEIMLVHPGDGSAYATSYKLQKRIESLSGGEKPNIMHSGHYHKAMYAFIRNVHGFETGTLCGQSQFMRGKNAAAHKGYFDIEVKYNKFGVQSIKPEFIPCYD